MNYEDSKVSVFSLHTRTKTVADRKVSYILMKIDEQNQRIQKVYQTLVRKDFQSRVFKSASWFMQNEFVKTQYESLNTQKCNINIEYDIWIAYKHDLKIMFSKNRFCNRIFIRIHSISVRMQSIVLL